jgi:hypothetical protein
MGGYYAYIIGDDGHITGRVQVICDDDKEAKRLANRWLTVTPSSYGRKPAWSNGSSRKSKAAVINP